MTLSQLTITVGLRTEALRAAESVQRKLARLTSVMVSSLSLACHVTPRFDHWYLACFERCLAGSEAVDAVDG